MMRPSPPSPKLLPWLARKAGISDDRAAALWREAERWAARQASAGSAAYYCAALDRLLRLVAGESLRADAASFGWRPWARAQERFWCVSMQLAHQLSAWGGRGWMLVGGNDRWPYAGWPRRPPGPGRAAP